MAIFFIAAIGYPNSDLDFTRPYTICHCEHPKGAWQSNYKRRDCFASQWQFLYRNLGVMW